MINNDKISKNFHTKEVYTVKITNRYLRTNLTEKKSTFAKEITSKIFHLNLSIWIVIHFTNKRNNWSYRWSQSEVKYLHKPFLMGHKSGIYLLEKFKVFENNAKTTANSWNGLIRIALKFVTFNTALMIFWQKNFFLNRSSLLGKQWARAKNVLHFLHKTPASTNSVLFSMISQRKLKREKKNNLSRKGLTLFGFFNPLILTPSTENHPFSP